MSNDNILIEWDNYHALTCLNYTHKGKIDVIYIDPPYNTGNKDFTYNDNYVDREDWYRHSKWLNFMSKRLELAKNLLKNKWLIFISIDDNEQAQLKLLCDIIFWADNFINIFAWHKKYGWWNDNKNAVSEHEYILCYSKISNPGEVLKDIEIDYNDIAKYDIDNEWNYFTATESILMRWPNSTPEKRPNLCYTIKTPDWNDILPREWKWTWCYSQDTLNTKLKKWELIWKKVNSKWMLFKKQLLFSKGEEIRGKKSRSILNYRYGIWQTGDGKTIIKDMFWTDAFSYPKPVSLIKHILKLSTDESSIILDFMAWSWTTGHAVLELNKEDGCNRKFILCTNNELNGVWSALIKDNPNLDKESMGICRRVTYPRLQKAITWYKIFWTEDVIEWLEWNLQYYRTDLIPVEKIDNIDDKQRTELTEKAWRMIAIKENTFDELELTEWYQVFASQDKQRKTAIYFRESQKYFDELIQNIWETKTTLYIFSYGRIDKKLYRKLPKNIIIEDIPGQYSKYIRKSI